MNVFRSRRHDVYTEEVNKIALSANDDKRVILKDGIHTLAHGHFRSLSVYDYFRTIFADDYYKTINANDYFKTLFDPGYFKTLFGGGSVSSGTICNSSLTNPLLGAPSDR